MPSHKMPSDSAIVSTLERAAAALTYFANPIRQHLPLRSAHERRPPLIRTQYVPSDEQLNRIDARFALAYTSKCIQHIHHVAAIQATPRRLIDSIVVAIWSDNQI